MSCLPPEDLEKYSVCPCRVNLGGIRLNKVMDIRWVGTDSIVCENGWITMTDSLGARGSPCMESQRETLLKEMHSQFLTFTSTLI